jgi:hypothetical protein
VGPPAAARLSLSTDTPCGLSDSHVLPLLQELAKFNDFFIDKEEELVMLEKELADHASALEADPSASAEALAAACTQLAHFHGELVLLEHWCSLNYAALVKILKKHDKRSSLTLRAPVLANVLRQPFYSTEIISGLVRATEARFHALSARLRALGTARAARAGAGVGPLADGRLSPPALIVLERPPAEAETAAQAADEASMLARTRAALSCWQELKKSASIGGGRARDQALESDDEEEDEEAAKKQRHDLPPTLAVPAC